MMGLRFTAVDLFCGAGGLTLGFEQAAHRGYKFKVIAAVDLWKRATQTYMENHPEVEVICGDIRDENTKKRIEVAANGHVDVIIGGPPCEAFSLAGKRDPNDPRAKLFYDYIDIVRRLQPHMFAMENVKGILTMATIREDMSEETKKNVIAALNELLDLKNVGRKRRAAPQYIIRNNTFKTPEEEKLIKFVKKYIVTAPEAAKQAFDRLGYEVQGGALNALNYGVPQRRERVFFLGARRGAGIKIIFPEEKHAKEPVPALHREGLKGGKTLRDAIGDLPPLEQRREDEVYEGGFSPIYMSRNRYRGWDEESYTILASARHILLHPDSPKMVKAGQDKWEFIDEAGKKPRRLSLRECARIQTFPDWYKFTGNTIEKYTLIGDAVPPLLAQKIAEAVLKALAQANINPSGG